MNYNIKAPYYFRVPKALYADSNRIFITICYRRASRPTAIFYLFYYPINLIDLQYHSTPNALDTSASNYKYYPISS